MILCLRNGSAESSCGDQFSKMNHYVSLASWIIDLPMTPPNLNLSLETLQQKRF